MAGGGHDGVHVDDERSLAEPDGDLVVPGELDLPFPVKGQAAGPGGQGHDLAGLDAAGLQHPDLGDQARGEGDGDGMGRLLGRGQAQVEPERGRPRQRRDRRRHRRQADRAGAGEGHQRLRDRPDPPQGARPDPALGGDGHVDQCAVPGAAVDGDLQLLGPPHQLVAAHPAGRHQAGRQPGHGGLAQLREGVVGAGGQRAQRDVAAVPGHHPVGAVAAQDHDRRHLPLGHGQHGLGRVARVLAQRHLQHLQLGQALGGQVPGAAAEVALEALGEAGAGRHHDHPAHPDGAEPGHEPVHHRALLGVVEHRGPGHQPADVPPGRGVGDDADADGDHALGLPDQPNRVNRANALPHPPPRRTVHHGVRHTRRPDGEEVLLA